MKKLIAISLLSLALSGCGTIANLANMGEVYGGVEANITGKHWGGSNIRWLDLPLTFVLDTATLPYTFFHELWVGL